MSILNNAINLKLGDKQVHSAWLQDVKVWPLSSSNNDSLSVTPPAEAIKAVFEYYDVYKKPADNEYDISGGYREVETCLELLSWSPPSSGYASAEYYAEAPYKTTCGNDPYGYGYNEDPAWQIWVRYSQTPSGSGWDSFHGTSCLAYYSTSLGPGTGEPGSGSNEEPVDVYSPYGEYTYYSGVPTGPLTVTEVVNLTAECPPDDCQSVYDEFIDYLGIAGGDMSCDVDETIPAVQTTYVQTITSVDKTDYTQEELDAFTAALSARYMQLNPTATEINIEIT